MHSSRRTRVGGAPAPPADLRYWEWPPAEGLGSWLALVGIGLVAAAVGAWSGRWELAAGCAATALAAGWRVWTPVGYELGPGGAVQTVFGFRRRLPWGAIVRCQLRRDGALLLTDDDPAPASRWFGLYLRWGRRRAELQALLEYYLRSHARIEAAEPGNDPTERRVARDASAPSRGA